MKNAEAVQERILILENKQRIEITKKTVNELLTNLNKLVKVYTEKHNYWDIPLDCWALVENPQKYYDEILLKNSSIKAVKNFKLEPARVAETLGVPRAIFLKDIQAVEPGTTGHGLDQRIGTIMLPSSQKNLFDYIEGRFVINLSELELLLDTHRIFVENEAQHQLYNYWLNFASTLNKHVELGYFSAALHSDIAPWFGLKCNGKFFVLDMNYIAELVKKLR